VATLSVLQFNLPGMQLFIRLDQVLRVIPMLSLTPVPQAPPYLKGLMNLGGQSLPVIDLAERIGLSEGLHYTIDTPILLCTDGSKTAGLVVEEVLGVAEVVPEDVQMRPLFDPSDTPVLGVIDTERRIKLAFVCLLTAVGVPMIFAGEEFADQHDFIIVIGAIPLDIDDDLVHRDRSDNRVFLPPDDHLGLVQTARFFIDRFLEHHAAPRNLKDAGALIPQEISRGYHLQAAAVETDDGLSLAASDQGKVFEVLFSYHFSPSVWVCRLII